MIVNKVNAEEVENYFSSHAQVICSKCNKRIEKSEDELNYAMTIGDEYSCCECFQSYIEHLIETKGK